MPTIKLRALITRTVRLPSALVALLRVEPAPVIVVVGPGGCTLQLPFGLAA